MGTWDLDGFQGNINREARRRWPRMTVQTEALALVEEIGEIARAIVKRDEGTRGTPEEWTANLRTEIGQAILVLFNLAKMEGHDISPILIDAWQGLLAKPDTEPAWSP